MASIPSPALLSLFCPQRRDLTYARADVLDLLRGSPSWAAAAVTLRDHDARASKSFYTQDEIGELLRKKVAYIKKTVGSKSKAQKVRYLSTAWRVSVTSSPPSPSPSSIYLVLRGTLLVIAPTLACPFQSMGKRESALTKQDPDERECVSTESKIGIYLISKADNLS